MKTKTETKTQVEKGLVRHIVELDAAGQPMDKCLCGFVWDRFRPPHNGSICQECIDEQRRRASA